MSTGVTVDGFVAKTLLEIKTDLETAFKGSFGESIDVSPQSVFGQIIGIMAERYADLWNLAEAVNAGFNPDAATGAQLENVAAITGTFRLPATNSEVTGTATGTPSTTLPVGRVASVENTLARFVTIEEVTLADPGAWVNTTVYALDVRRRNASRVYQVITAGTSAGSGGPTTTDADITDGTVHWMYLGEGTGVVDVDFESEETGPVIAVSGSMNTIETPVSGWSNIVNLLDADLGSDLETDSALRIRREIQLRASGKAALDSIRAALLRVDDVSAVTVFENVTDATDGDGLPPHSIEALVSDGDDAEIWQAVFDNVAAGIQTFGTESGSVVDSQGISHTVKFSRPVDRNVWLIVNLIVDEDEYPADGDDQIKAAIVAYGDTFATGKNAVASSLAAQCFDVAGVLDVSSLLLGLSNPPTVSTTIAVSVRQLAKFDTSRITVNTTPGTP